MDHKDNDLSRDIAERVQFANLVRDKVKTERSKKCSYKQLQKARRHTKHYTKEMFEFKPPSSDSSDFKAISAIIFERVFSNQFE